MRCHRALRSPLPVWADRTDRLLRRDPIAGEDRKKCHRNDDQPMQHAPASPLTSDECPLSRVQQTFHFALQMSVFNPKRTSTPFSGSENRIDHPPDSISRCRELIAVAVSQIDGDPIVSDRLVDPTLEITVAHFKK